MNFNKKLSLILESILLQDGEYTIEDDQLETQDSDALPDEDKFGNEETYKLKENGQEIAQITISLVDGVIRFKMARSKTDRDRLHYIATINPNVKPINPKHNTITISQLPIIKKFIITQEPMVIYYYIIDWLMTRFPEGEPKLLTKPWAACMYATLILRHRWPEAEPMIRGYPSIWETYKDKFNIIDQT